LADHLKEWCVHSIEKPFTEVEPFTGVEPFTWVGCWHIISCARELSPFHDGSIPSSNKFLYSINIIRGFLSNALYLREGASASYLLQYKPTMFSYNEHKE